MTNDELLEHCFMHVYGADVSNAAMHCAEVRFSPITFRLQEALGMAARTGSVNAYARQALIHVTAHNSTYAEDTGR